MSARWTRAGPCFHVKSPWSVNRTTKKCRAFIVLCVIPAACRCDQLRFSHLWWQAACWCAPPHSARWMKASLMRSHVGADWSVEGRSSASLLRRQQQMSHRSRATHSNTEFISQSAPRPGLHLQRLHETPKPSCFRKNYGKSKFKYKQVFITVWGEWVELL